MSYEVLARKYRPQRFDQMIGHTGTRQALINALDTHKLHHTYLLTGTRGVGKTSLARLLAKCLNCEKKITSTPCEVCANCIAIQNNQFVDLIEVDAASRTRVEDTQVLLENVQYKPTLGRYKIYLIDEVHMLSTHSFNALLKTLEEPPSHVIFLLATTDPQKLPDTIISRCLHFQLKSLNSQEITQQLIHILDQEKIQYDLSALEKIAKLAKGSVRDALSLLEPVILHNKENQITLKDVQSIFGYMSEMDSWAFIEAMHHRDMNTVKKLIQSISAQSIDFEKVLDEILEALYKIIWVQQDSTLIHSGDTESSRQMITLSESIKPEQVHLYYQIAVMGKKDLALAPTPQIGFEVTLLRMIAFTPVSKATYAPKKPIQDDLITKQSDTHISPTLDPSTNFNWPEWIKKLPLTGFLKSLAFNCTLQSFQSEVITLVLDPRQKVLYSSQRETSLQKMLSETLKKEIKLHIKIGTKIEATPATLEAEKAQQHQQAAYQSILENSNIKAIQNTFDATIQTESIHLNSEKYYE